MNFLTSYVLPIIYLIIFSFVLGNNKYLREHGVASVFIVFFFIFKCLAGMAADYISLHYFDNGGDVWLYYSDGLSLYQTFKHSPAAFFSQLRQMFTITDLNLLNPDSDFIRTVFEGIKFIHFVFNLFSFGNIYTNTILFNALAVPAYLRCWVFLKKYTGNWLAGVWIFLFPSAFFYSSNILKEGICCVLIALLLPLLHKMFQQVKLKCVVATVLLWVLLFFFKFIVALTLVVACVIWLVTARFRRLKWQLSSLIVLILALLFFATAWVAPLPNLPQFFVNRQQEFLALPASSIMDVHVLRPTFLSFLEGLPLAIGHVFFSPFPGDGESIFYWMHSLEIWGCWFLMFSYILRNKLKLSSIKVKPMLWGMVVFAIISLLIIGYIVPNLGALVRYRSIFLPWFFIFLWYVFNMQPPKRDERKPDPVLE